MVLSSIEVKYASAERLVRGTMIWQTVSSKQLQETVRPELVEGR